MSEKVKKHGVAVVSAKLENKKDLQDKVESSDEGNDDDGDSDDDEGDDDAGEDVEENLRSVLASIWKQIGKLIIEKSNAEAGKNNKAIEDKIAKLKSDAADIKAALQGMSEEKDEIVSTTSFDVGKKQFHLPTSKDVGAFREGETDPRLYLQDVEYACETLQIGKSNYCRALANCVREQDDIRRWVQQISQQRNHDWKSISDEFEQRYLTKNLKYMRKVKLAQLKQSEKETVNTFHAKFCRLYTLMGKSTHDEECAQEFVMKLRADIQYSIAKLGKMDTLELEEARQIAVDIENTDQVHKMVNGKDKVGFVAGRDSKGIKCFKCHKFGHAKKDCPTWKKKSKDADAEENKDSVDKHQGKNKKTVKFANITCFKCNKKGHYASKCKEKKEESQTDEDDDELEVNAVR
jgi:hypothetical protein